MTNESKALAITTTDIVESDYQAFCAALSASVRGRSFLAEYARRNRHADTEMVLAALERLQTQVRVQIAAPQADRIRQELCALLAAMRATRPEIDDSPAAIRAAKQAALLGFVESRIEAIVTSERQASVLPEEVEALVTPERAAKAARSVLAVVPAPEQPELPIPSPAAEQPPEISLVRATAEMTEVTFIAKPLLAEPVVTEAAAPELVAPPKTAAKLPAVDPLAAIMALTDAERIALFT
ncbi:MAG TPA: hypothetical protein VGC38_03900 [Pseudolabrys sp.]